MHRQKDKAEQGTLQVTAVAAPTKPRKPEQPRNGDDREAGRRPDECREPGHKGPGAQRGGISEPKVLASHPYNLRCRVRDDVQAPSAGQPPLLTAGAEFGIGVQNAQV